MNDEQMQKTIDSLKDGDYKKYLEKVYTEKHEL